MIVGNVHAERFCRQLFQNHLTFMGGRSFSRRCHSRSITVSQRLLSLNRQAFPESLASPLRLRGSLQERAQHGEVDNNLFHIPARGQLDNLGNVAETRLVHDIADNPARRRDVRARERFLFPQSRSALRVSGIVRSNFFAVRARNSHASSQQKGETSSF